MSEWSVRGQYRIFRKSNLLYVTYEGVVSMRDILETIDAVDQSKVIRPGMHELIDLSRVSRHKIPLGDFIKLAELLVCLYRRRGASGRFAIWAPQDMTYRMSIFQCMVMRRLGNVDGRAFRKRHAALHYLLKDGVQSLEGMLQAH